MLAVEVLSEKWVNGTVSTIVSQRNQAKRYIERPVVFAVLGTHADDGKRLLTTEKAAELCTANDAVYVEVDARKKQQVVAAFDVLVSTVSVVLRMAGECLLTLCLQALGLQQRPDALPPYLPSREVFIKRIGAA